uniref:ATP synthase F0 subunit 8 n=1 Tax=Nesophrosyne sp. 23 GMB-2012 TaxID=1223949 RepID=UPI002181FE95|nr:ATP synthase F0 subunit 8 [Nesophrosyne sp. 23 GMB-2012]UVI59715.1 ATP synthase F0 subunit 8 [Nesophrosyne sp. 23 GMB-2012]
MPQMAPVWWTLILLTTMITLLLLMIMSYFSSISKIYLNSNNKLNKFMWKWY